MNKRKTHFVNKKQEKIVKILIYFLCKNCNAPSASLKKVTQQPPLKL